VAPNAWARSPRWQAGSAGGLRQGVPRSEERGERGGALLAGAAGAAAAAGGERRPASRAAAGLKREASGGVGGGRGAGPVPERPGAQLPAPPAQGGPAACLQGASVRRPATPPAAKCYVSGVSWAAGAVCGTHAFVMRVMRGGLLAPCSAEGYYFGWRAPSVVRPCPAGITLAHNPLARILPQKKNKTKLVSLNLYPAIAVCRQGVCAGSGWMQQHWFGPAAIAAWQRGGCARSAAPSSRPLYLDT
jgi:hypothetical protein